jgi:hypothetical protein
MLLHPIHAIVLVLNPTFAYSCNFDFYGEVWKGSLHVFVLSYLIEKLTKPLIMRWRCIGMQIDYFSLSDVNAISLDNINILSQWRVEYETAIEEAPK